MDILLKNFIAFIIPAFILAVLATTLIVRSPHLRETRFAAAFIGLYSMMFLVEWWRMTLPERYSFWLHHILTGTLTMLTLSIIVHSAYLIMEHHRTITLRFSPWIFYVPVMMQPLYIFFIYHQYGTAYETINGWYYVHHLFFTYLANPFMAIYLSSIIFLLKHAIRTAPSYARKKLYKLFLHNLYSVLALGVLFIVICRTNAIIPDPILFIIFYTSLVYGFGMLRHQFSPSLAERYHSVMNLSPIGIVVLNERGEIEEINDVAQQMIPKSVKRPIELFSSKEDRARLYKLAAQLNRQERINDILLKYEHPTTLQLIEISLNMTRLVIDSRIHYTVTIRDVTIEKQQERKNYRLAYHDSLTNLYNRAYFQKHIIDQIEAYPHCALILSDLNFFKQVNDTYGHDTGDAVLQFTATQFEELAMDDMIVTRLGGDEFIFFIPDARDVNCDQFALYLQRHFEQTAFHWQRESFHIVPSFGVAVRQENQSYEQLFREADEAMYRNKIFIKKQYSEAPKA